MFKTITLTCEQRKKLPRVFSGLNADCERGELTLHIAKIVCTPRKAKAKVKKGAAKK